MAASTLSSSSNSSFSSSCLVRFRCRPFALLLIVLCVLSISILTLYSLTTPRNNIHLYLPSLNVIHNMPSHHDLFARLIGKSVSSHPSSRCLTNGASSSDTNTTLGSERLFRKILHAPWADLPLLRQILKESMELSTCNSLINQWSQKQLNHLCRRRNPSPFSYWQIYHAQHTWTHLSHLPEVYHVHTSGAIADECDLALPHLMPALFHSPFRHQLSEFNALIPLGLMSTCLNYHVNTTYENEWIGSGSWKSQKHSPPCQYGRDLDWNRLPNDAFIVWNHGLLDNFIEQANSGHEGLVDTMNDFFHTTFGFVPPLNFTMPKPLPGFPCCSHFFTSKRLLHALSQLQLLASFYLMSRFDPDALCPWEVVPNDGFNTHDKNRCYGFMLERVNVAFMVLVADIVDIEKTYDGQCSDSKLYQRANLRLRHPELRGLLSIEKINAAYDMLLCKFRV